MILADLVTTARDMRQDRSVLSCNIYFTSRRSAMLVKIICKRTDKDMCMHRIRDYFGELLTRELR